MRRRLPTTVLAGLVLALVCGAPVAGASAGHLSACPEGYRGFRAGAAKVDITPRHWPVAEAAYGIGRMAVGAAHPFYARSIAVQSCSSRAIVVFTALDSQGYFTAYKEDPGAGAAGFGTTAIRATVKRDLGIDPSHVLIAATHTHNSPDSVGVWGGSVTANNKAPYLRVAKAGAVASIERALRALRPAVLRSGSTDISALLGTYPQVRRDPKDYPTDHVVRVLQAVDPNRCQAIATLVNAGVHADIAGPIDGPHGQLIDPDWPGRVASDAEHAFRGSTSVVTAGAVGRTGPSFPAGTDPNSKNQLTEIRAYGDVMYRRVATALAGSHRLATGPISTRATNLTEGLAEPALAALFFDGAGTSQLHGVMRSVVPPYTTGAAFAAEVQTFRIGNLMFAGAPGEAYPEIATELAKRVRAGAAPFVFGLAADQLGYTPPAFEYPVVALVDGGDEGFFTINSHFGDDIINRHLAAARQLGFAATGTYNGATAGPVNPPDQQNPPPQGQNPPEPHETSAPLACPRQAPHHSKHHRHHRRRRRDPDRDGDHDRPGQR